MTSKRLLAIANYIEKDDKLIDVGCDHGYLGIYLKKNNLVKDLLLTDINKNALNNAINNINKSNIDIETLLTNGLNNIDLSNYNTVSISGMGETTIKNILNILNNDNNIKKIIVQSNNNLDKLRTDMNNLNYFLEDEKTVLEDNIFYVIGKYIKSSEKNSKEEIQFGINKKDKKEYYKYLLNKFKEIDNKISNNHSKDKELLKEKINILNKLLKESR